MTLSIQLSQKLATKLKEEAQQRKVRPEQLAVNILIDFLDDQQDDGIPSVAEVVRQIRSLPKDDRFVSLPEKSLADMLKNAPADPDFDLEQWEAEWEKVEEELEQLSY